MVAAVAAGIVIAGAGGAFAATQLDSPTARSQAIITDAAGQLNIDPSKLTSALEKAIDDQIDAAVQAGKLTSAQGAALKARVASGQVPLVAGLGLRRRGFDGGRSRRAFRVWVPCVRGRGCVCGVVSRDLDRRAAYRARKRQDTRSDRSRPRQDATGS